MVLRACLVVEFHTKSSWSGNNQVIWRSCHVIRLKCLPRPMYTGMLQDAELLLAQAC